jgi:hypothetical protein
MKQVILSIATVLMMVVSAFAGVNEGVKDEVNSQAAQSFKRDFVNARNISWEKRQDYVKVTFSLNEQVLFAYYNNTGELQAVVRNITSDQLPINLLTDLKKDYGDFWISDLFEIASNDQTTYYITVESANKTIVLKSEGTNDWTVFSKTRKNTEQ